MFKVSTVKLDMEDSLKQKLKFICEFCHVKPTIVNGSIKRISNSNLNYIEPHKVIIKNKVFLVFNYSNDVYIDNLNTKIKLTELESYIKNMNT